MDEAWPLVACILPTSDRDTEQMFGNVCFPEGLGRGKKGGQLSPLFQLISFCFERCLRMNAHCGCGLVLLESTTFNPLSFHNLVV